MLHLRTLTYRTGFIDLSTSQLSNSAHLHEAFFALLGRHILPGGRTRGGGGRDRRGRRQVPVERATRLGVEDDHIDVDDVGGPVVNVVVALHGQDAGLAAVPESHAEVDIVSHAREMVMQPSSVLTLMQRNSETELSKPCTYLAFPSLSIRRALFLAFGSETCRKSVWFIWLEHGSLGLSVGSWNLLIVHVPFF